MTVSYTSEVATCRGFGCFLKLLLRWRASIYKLVWLDLICFLILYYILNFTYRWGLDEHGKKIFEGVVAYCLKYSDLIPLSFVLGFYVSIVMTRWWNQYTTIPWPDSIAVFVSCNVHGLDERGRLMRRTMMRYVCLCITMVLTMISPKVKKRFPTLDHLIEAGLLQENEKQIMEELNQKFPKHSKHWMPIVWSASIVTRARKEGRIRDDFAVKTIIDELNKFRAQCGLLLSYDNISVPLVYTQVVTLAVYSYFATAIMARQWTKTHTVEDPITGITQHLSNIDLYFPIFTCLQFFFYMGWLKVAESLINPFGDDDDDFEVSWMVDRNIQVSYMIVDEMHHNHPELIRDQYWDEVFPMELPYTVASEKQRETVPMPSTAKIDVPPSQQLLTNPSSVKIDEMTMNEDATSGIHFSAGGGRSIRRKPSVMSMTSNSVGNSHSTQQPSMQRVASVASVLKRMFSREDRGQSGVPGHEVDGNQKLETPTSGSALTRAAGGSMRITDQVIEELDEQNTITSQATKKDERGTITGLFGPPPPSEPVNVPVNKNSRNIAHEPNVNDSNKPHHHHHSLMSSSAPVAWGEKKLSLSPAATSEGPDTYNIRMRSRLDSDIGPTLSAAVSRLIVPEDETASLASSDDNNENDEFQSLKEAREKEKMVRYMHKLMARSVSAQQNIGSEGMMDNDILLAELHKESQRRDQEGADSNFSTSPKDA